MRLFKIVRKLIHTYPIFNMADQVMNIQLQKGSALYDHSFPAADDWRHIGKSSVLSLSSLMIYRDKIHNAFDTNFNGNKVFRLRKYHRLSQEPLTGLNKVSFIMGVGSVAAGAAWAAPIIYKAMTKHGRRTQWPPQL